jgi:hypothetical protein
LAQLAREIAMNIRDREAILADFDLTERDYARIEQLDFYKRALDQMTIEWNSALSTNERVKLYSAAAIEKALPVLSRRMLNEKEPLSSAVECGKFLARNAGIGDAKQPMPNNSERFVITINLGADVEKYDKSIKIDANDTPEAVALKAITAPDGN